MEILINTQPITNEVPVTNTTPNVTVAAIQGGRGLPGLSAYQIALNNGFKGTETEWLESLHGQYDDTEIYARISIADQKILVLDAKTSALEGQDLILGERITTLENTIGTLNDSLEAVLNGN